MNVYTYVRREELCLEEGIIGVRWVDSLRGDIVKSRLVAREFASRRDRDDMFAAILPLIPSKFVFSDTASRENSWCNFQKTLRVGCQKNFLLCRLRRDPGRGHLEEGRSRGKIVQGNVWNKVSTLSVAEGGGEKMKALDFHACVAVSCWYYPSCLRMCSL